MTKKIFAIKQGDKLRYLKIKRQKVNVPPFGILTAEELMENSEALKTLILRSPDSSVFEDAEKNEYEAQLASEEAEIKKAEDDAKAASLEAEKAEYEKAKAIVAEYEAKYPVADEGTDPESTTDEPKGEPVKEEDKEPAPAKKSTKK